ncbi:MAG: DUF1887 family protein [Anaerolineae bacterium]|nr:DUF1887 family protein [Anaerolineae bacterium]
MVEKTTHTMIALVSGQRMQNIIPIFQKGAQYEQVWLIRSTDADTPNSYFALAQQHTIEALTHISSVASVDPAVNAYGIADTQAVVSDIIQKSPGEVIVNFTGGTKCMSIGAYLAAQGAQIRTLYVDTASEELVWFRPDGSIQRKEPFDLADRMTVATYLKAYGKNVDEAATKKHHPGLEAIEAARALRAYWPSYVNIFHRLGTAISQKKPLPDIKTSDATNILEHYGLLKTDESGQWQASDKGRQFLTGGWLECFVYVNLLDSNEFDDVQLGLRLAGVENEFDVAATRKGQLAVIECKSGDPGGQNTLNKLQAIRSSVGTFTRIFMVSSQSKVPKSFEKRACEYGVKATITRESLYRIADLIKQKMRGLS